MLKYKEAILFVILSIVIVVFALYKAIPQVVGVITEYKTIQSKTTQVANLQKQVDTYKAQEASKESDVGIIKKIYKTEAQDVDTEASFALMFEDIMNMTKYTGVKVYSIQYNYNDADNNFIKNGNGAFNTCRLDLELIARYKDFEIFIIEILKYPYLINVNTIKLEPYAKNKRILLIQLELILYNEK